MNLTLSLLAGLVLLLPGITALASWNLLAHRQAARRPELPLTAVSALFVAIAVSLAAHLIGFALAGLAREALVEWNALTPPFELPVFDDPFAVVEKYGAGASRPTRTELAAFGALIAAECTLVASVLQSRGLDVVLDDIDLRGMGWAYRHYLQPLRHGYTPIAFVLTSAIEKGYGVGFEGPIDDLRLGDDAQVKMLSLGQPERFLYELRPRRTAGEAEPGRKVTRALAAGPELVFYESKFVGGVVNIDPSTILNIVIHNYSAEVVEEIAEAPADAGVAS